MTTPPRIVHVIGRDEWVTATREGVRPESGGDFVHCADPGQVAGVVERYFADRDDLLVLTIDAGRLEAPVVWEDTTGRGERFPHVYGTIPPEAVVAVQPLRAQRA